MKYVICKIGKEEYGLSINNVLSIEKMQTIHVLPLTPSFVPGIINHRGDIVTILDPKKLLEIKDDLKQDINKKRIIIIRDKNELIGMIVDAAIDVLDIDSHKVKARTENELVKVAEIKDRFILIFDIGTLMNNARLR